MKREKIKSRMIASIGYSAAEKICEVEFAGSGKVYCYGPMEPEDYREFIGADSIGNHFLKMVKPKYACTRVVPEKTDAEAEAAKVDPEDIAPDHAPPPTGKEEDAD